MMVNRASYTEFADWCENNPAGRLISLSDRTFLLAVDMGCFPEWQGKMWRCTCKDHRHGMTAETPIITYNALAAYRRAQ